MKALRRNITIDEAICPCSCGATPSSALLDNIQSLRDRVGFALPFNSIVRCPPYNRKIGGSIISAHLLSLEVGPFGAVDIGIKPRSRKDGGYPDKTFRIITVAKELGANNIEVCDGHIHIGWVPFEHPMFETLYWGRSK
ncbi:hypothetical protein LCGC14_1436640 [marine sediment metagenome]|uniref:Peptidase M15A C-terminal domain-containing protein n=1 Tax=marine sediment metagenome TaxID=412755 RepID=A0A0F9JM25_9ZZZZ